MDFSYFIISLCFQCHSFTRKLTNTSKVVVDLFEVVTNKAAYYEEQKGSLVVARRILDSEIRFKTMKNAVSRVEEISEMLEYGCKCLAKKLNRYGLDASMLAQCQEAKKRFFAAARDDFFSFFLFRHFCHSFYINFSSDPALLPQRKSAYSYYCRRMES